MTKSRKRMLLSSIAMLLVALVALGSATYAWFTVSKTVTADGMQVKAIAKAGLEICNTDNGGGTYTSSVSFGQTSEGYSLMPVSWDGGNSAGFIPAANVDDETNGVYTGAFKATGDAIPAPATTSLAMAKSTGNYFAVYKVWVRSAATATDPFKSDSHNVAAKVTIGGTNANFCRVKLIDDAASTTRGIYGDSQSASTSASVVTAAGSDKATYTVTACPSTANITASSTVANAEVGTSYTLVVWFDGEDADCKNSAKNNTATISIEFEATDM